ncbi:hypothetical protein MHA_2056 [Mannheimia haemolytica PHL213]|nr:hypothetical protein MHA_2056 [Mannheimia haemolytica PHL213]
MLLKSLTSEIPKNKLSRHSIKQSLNEENMLFLNAKN